MIKPEIDIESVEEAKKYGLMITCGRRFGVLRFQSSTTKHYFFGVLKQYIPNIIIINCDSSGDRFENDIKNIHETDIVIFDNIKNHPHINDDLKHIFKRNILVW